MVVVAVGLVRGVAVGVRTGSTAASTVPYSGGSGGPGVGEWLRRVASPRVVSFTKAEKKTMFGKEVVEVLVLYTHVFYKHDLHFHPPSSSFSPHLCVGVLLLALHPPPPPSPPPPLTLTPLTLSGRSGACSGAGSPCSSLAEGVRAVVVWFTGVLLLGFAPRRALWPVALLVALV